MCTDSAHTIVCKIGKYLYNRPNIVFSPSSDGGPLALLILHIAFVKVEERGINVRKCFEFFRCEW